MDSNRYTLDSQSSRKQVAPVRGAPYPATHNNGFRKEIRIEVRTEVITHTDDLEDGEEDSRRCHRGWERQHGRDIRSYLGGRHHPVESIVAGAASDSPKSHEGYEKQMATVRRSSQRHIAAKR